MEKAKGASPCWEGRLGEAYAFAHLIWLPDAMEALHDLKGAIDAADTQSVSHFCDRLQESAMAVGALVYVQAAAEAGRAYASGDIGTASRIVTTSLAQLILANDWLERRSAPRRMGKRSHR